MPPPTANMDAFAALMRGAGGSSESPLGRTYADQLAGTDSPRPLPANAADAGAPPDLSALLANVGLDASNPLAQMLSTMLSGQPENPAMATPPTPLRKTWLDRLLPLVHILTMVAIACYAVFVMEPTKRRESMGLQATLDGVRGNPGDVPWNAWQRLVGERGTASRIVNAVVGGGIAEVVRSLMTDRRCPSLTKLLSHCSICSSPPS